MAVVPYSSAHKPRTFGCVGILYAGYKDIYSKGASFHLNPGFRLVETPNYGNVDWLITYELRGRTPRFREVEPRAGGNGSGIGMSADGKRMTYLSHVGTPMHSGNLLGWNPAKLAEKPANYALKGVGVTTQLAFHPTLPLAAVPGGSSAVLFDRESGKISEDRLQLTSTGLDNVKVDDLILRQTNSAIESGEDVTVIGNPGLGDAILTQTLTTGVVSNPTRQFEDQTYIQTSVAVNPGTSGGPLFNSQGQVIGMIVSKANLEGTSFAIPASRLRHWLEDQTGEKRK